MNGAAERGRSEWKVLESELRLQNNQSKSSLRIIPAITKATRESPPPFVNRLRGCKQAGFLLDQMFSSSHDNPIWSGWSA
jgi:hypothetical protein